MRPSLVLTVESSADFFVSPSRMVRRLRINPCKGLVNLLESPRLALEWGQHLNQVLLFMCFKDASSLRLLA